MTKFDDAFIESSEWLGIPGVETVIPNEADHSILVIVSNSSLLVSGLIPDSLMGVNVNLLYVQGLHVNHEHALQVKKG